LVSEKQRVFLEVANSSRAAAGEMTRFRLVRAHEVAPICRHPQIFNRVAAARGVTWLIWRMDIDVLPPEQPIKDSVGIDYPLYPLRYSDETPPT
jgi:hypothetical protein